MTPSSDRDDGLDEGRDQQRNQQRNHRRDPSPEQRRDGVRDDTGRTEDPRVVRTRHDVLGAALQVLVDEGSESVTHPNLARVTGYSRATVYKHWPTRHDLLRGAFGHIRGVDHVHPTGDVRADLVTELTRLRRALEQQGLDRAIGVLVDLTATDPDLVEVRDRLVADGERVVRELLGPLLGPAGLEAATLMLCGSILHAAMLHGRLPSDEVVAAAVDLVLPPPVRP